MLAVAGNEGNALLAGVGGWSVPEVRAWNKTTAFCYAARRVPVNEPIILLNGEGSAAGPVNNVAVMSAVSPPTHRRERSGGGQRCGSISCEGHGTRATG